MPPVDWRRLYSANQAAIAERAGSNASTHAVESGGWPLSAVLRAGSPGHGGPAMLGLGGRGPAGRAGHVVHSPAGLDPAAPAPLVVALHGCTQTAASLAADTRLDELADRHGLVVAYPEQSEGRNLRRCWNWFEPAHQVRGGGEPALLAATVAGLATGVEGQAIDRDRVFLAGFSAGGAMACVLAATYPELFAGLAVHSGLAYRSALGLRAALQAMRHGADDPGGLGHAARAAMGEPWRILPTIVLHGNADRIVHPVNGDQIAMQWRHVNGLADESEPAVTERRRVEGGHAYTRRRWYGGRGTPVVEQIAVGGLAHAWAGGAAGGAYADPRGPSAAEAIWRFFTEATAAGARAAGEGPTAAEPLTVELPARRTLTAPARAR